MTGGHGVGAQHTEIDRDATHADASCDDSASVDDPSTAPRPGPVARLVLAFLDFYQKGISPLTPPSCRFEPTCSQYAVEAVRGRGVLIGSALAIWRILRCAPWSAGGWDPVPPPRAPVPRGGAHLRGAAAPDPPVADDVRHPAP